jgi:predicted alpha/beta superfamily hydrolase
MRRRDTFTLLAVLVGAASLPPAGAADPTPVSIPQAEQFDVKSKGGLDYRIFVAAPKGKAPEKGYPVIYLTDGNGNFPTLLSAVRRQGPGGAAAVVVGIGYPSDDEKEFNARRTLDLTPLTSPEWLKSLPKGGPPLGKTGGNDEFLKFIEDELKPLVERKYATDRARQTLFGHSFGGLFALHVLFTRPDAFQTYLASSPSIWWNDRSVLAEEQAFAKKLAGRAVNARLLVTVGEWEQKPGPKVTKERADMLRDRRQVDNARELADRMARLPVKKLTVSFREFAEEDHGSVVLPAASRGVRFALDDRP